jgi:hypothetical protein
MLPAPTTTVVQSAFAAAGLHPHVQLVVDNVFWEQSVLNAQVRLRYAAAHPICCGEPACYVPAFQSAGLQRVANHIQAEDLLDEAPRLHVIVMLELEPGFRFLNPGLGASAGATLQYSHPESDVRGVS